MYEVYFEFKKYELLLKNSKMNKNSSLKQIESSEELEIPTDFRKQVNLDSLFAYGCGERVCEFLEYTDILNLRLINKFISQAYE
jgi:hypothetical protein